MNILLTSVGRRGYLIDYFKKALQGKGEVHVANSSAVTPAFSRADHSVVTPLIYDKEYIDFLLTYCREYKISVIISLFDVDLPILAKNKDRFAQIGVRVLVSDSDVINVCNDKWETYTYLCSHGINVPKTYLTLESAYEAIQIGKIDYPLILKPRWGMGSIAVMKADNQQELEVFYRKIKKEIQKSYLKYESNEDISKAILIQEVLNGQEYGLDVINDLEGNYQNTIVKQKYAMRSGETDCALTVRWEEADKLGKTLSILLHHIGNLDVDVFKVEEKIYVLEMNARFGGGYPFSHLAGVDLPQAIIDWMMYGETDRKNLMYKETVMGHKDITLVEIKKP